MIKLTTLIKAYKLALSNLGEKVGKWGKVYLGEVRFIGEKVPDSIVFTFSNSSTMEPGAMGISAALNIELVEKLKGGLESITIAKDYINKSLEINEAGRMLVVLDNLFTTLSNMGPDFWEDAMVKDVYFDFDKDLAIFDTDIFKAPISTDGHLVLIGN